MKIVNTVSRKLANRVRVDAKEANPHLQGHDKARTCRGDDPIRARLPRCRTCCQCQKKIEKGEIAVCWCPDDEFGYYVTDLTVHLDDCGEDLPDAKWKYWG